MVALPSKLFYNPMIPACLWFVSRDKKSHKDRHGRVLFIDARKIGTLADRRHRELTYEDVKGISDTYRSWRGSAGRKYKDTNNLAERSLGPSAMARNVRHAPKTPGGTEMFGVLMTCTVAWRARWQGASRMLHQILPGTMGACVGAWGMGRG